MNFTLKQSKNYPNLYVKKYTKKVFYDNLWTEELIESRGHVQLENGTVVIRPFTKVFNRNENGTDIPLDEICLAVQKINGFMAAITYVGHGINDLVVSTTGSLDSKFVDIAKRYITPNIREVLSKQVYRGTTFLFEVCAPEDPHIIQQEEGLYLIGCRDVNDNEHYYSTLVRETLLDNLAGVLEVNRPNWIRCVFSDLLDIVKFSNMEGYVVYSQVSDTSLKLKSPYYLACKAAARIKDIEKLSRKYIDEEFYPLIDYLVDNKEYFYKLDEQAKLHYINSFLGRQI